ncbi:hypothetical protein XENTR_v10019601 [Xenopus tropicalis]|uniref:Phospholipase A2 inhibitor subunit gamma B n=1 Tax=Xenopus tropicalis TaxID=8364 RepID=A0A8J0R7T5_XENTR|nr:phospholipase A2 inhibitor subunit gamma B [Xenopus tropicalis]KAE8594352.1 hypothetical protein XENTR_v10019601 [Xenopus tropicalis]|eukprot:XP_004919845.1 PREDICTED: phospholipase A2 inhibitor subunit gamma B-like [Xenopus tropicalis]
MRDLLKLLYVFPSLISSGYSLKCMVCFAPGAPNCTGNSETCPAGTVCSSTYTVKTEGGIKVSEFSGRTCMPPDQCQEPGSFSTSNSTFKKGFSCCNTDNCTPAPLTLPDDNVNPNGLTCPTCTLDGAGFCNTGETMQCTGNENNCLVQITKMSGAVSSSGVLRGCASPSICRIGSQSISANGINVDVEITCTGGSNGVNSVVSYPLAAFLLLKLFDF